MSSTSAPSKNVRLKDIAAITGLSLTAVSRALRDKPDIGEATKRKVKQVAAGMHYRPHGIARSLALGTTRTIGLANMNIANPLYTELARAIAAESEQFNYGLLLFLAPAIPVSLADHVSLITRKNADGIIVLAGNLDADEASRVAGQKGEPIVFFGRAPEPGIFQVTVDREAGVRNAAESLARLGHRAFAFLCIPEMSSAKLLGLRNAMKQLELPLRPEWLLPGTGTMESGYAATRKLLRGPLPTVVFYHNDLAALGGLHAFHEAGIRVPEDISVVGYDNIPMADHSCPPLTTIASPIQPIAGALVRMLLALIEQPDREPEQIIIMPELITRVSTGPRGRTRRGV